MARFVNAPSNRRPRRTSPPVAGATTVLLRRASPGRAGPPPVVASDCESLDASGGEKCDVYSRFRYAGGQITAAFDPPRRPCHPDEITVTLGDGTVVGHVVHEVSDPELSVPLSPAGANAASQHRPLFFRLAIPGAEGVPAVGLRL